MFVVSQPLSSILKAAYELNCMDSTNHSAIAKNSEFTCRIVATPGRLVHHIVEVDFSLKAVEYVVFDEADRYSRSLPLTLLSLTLSIFACTCFHTSCTSACIGSAFCGSKPLPVRCRRLFEMGFEQQLREIIAAMPESRQTLLFSATLPGILTDFVRAGNVHFPLLLRNFRRQWLFVI